MSTPTPTSTQSATAQSHAEATAYLTSLLNRTLHIHTSDGRTFIGQMKCTDRERNVILAMTYEVRKLDGEDGVSGMSERGMGERKRFVGLVVVPGRFITGVEVEG